MDRARSAPKAPRALVLLYGGTFDPVHNGHLAMAEAAWRATGSDRLIFLPAGQSPFKAPDATAGVHRLAMLEAALASLPEAEIDPRELHRPGPSYTVDTLAAYREALGPEVALLWLLGADAAMTLHQWQGAEALPSLAHFLVVARPGAEAFAPVTPFWRALRACPVSAFRGAPAGGWAYLEAGAYPIASRAVRASLRAARAGSGCPGHDLLPPAVSSYIQAHGLYGTFS